MEIQNGFSILVCLFILPCCSWSVTRLSDDAPRGGPQIESISKIGQVPQGRAIICSRLPIKITGIDDHNTSAAYRAHRKAAFFVDPGTHLVTVHLGDEWRFPALPLLGSIAVEPGSAVEIKLASSVPNLAEMTPLVQDTLWSVELVTDETACR